MYDSGLHEPKDALILDLHLGRLTEYGREFYEWLLGDEFRAIAGASGDFNNYSQRKLLDHLTGKTSFTQPSFYLALCTVVPTDASTGANITEANYTGYARLNVAAASWVAASTAEPSETHNTGSLTFAACTGGSSTIIGWAGCDSVTTAAGNALCWGSATSTVISTTQTPPTIADSALSITLT